MRVLGQFLNKSDETSNNTSHGAAECAVLDMNKPPEQAYSQQILLPLIIWSICASFYSYQYVLRIIPNIIENDIISKYGMDSALFGQYSGIFYIGYALMQIPMGILLDSKGPRIVLSVSVILSAAGLLPIIFCDQWQYLLLGRVITGIGAAGSLIGTFKVIRILFSDQHAPHFFGVTIGLGFVGVFLFAEPLRSLAGSMGYTHVILLLVAYGAGLALIMYIILPNTNDNSNVISKKSFLECLLNKNILLLSIVGGLLSAPLEAFSYVWGGKYLELFYEMNNEQANHLLSLIFIGACIGAPVLSSLAEYTKKYIRTILTAGVIMGLLFGLLFGRMLEGVSLQIAFFVIGMCTSYPELYIISTYVPASRVAIATGTANTIVMLFGYGINALTGSVIAHSQFSNSKTSYLLGALVTPLSVVLGCLLLVFICYSIPKKHQR